MNKEQRNKKDVKQNTRNRLINKRYTSTIKSLNRSFISKIKLIEIEKDDKTKIELKQNISNILKQFYSFSQMFLSFFYNQQLHLIFFLLQLKGTFLAYYFSAYVIHVKHFFLILKQQ